MSVELNKQKKHMKVEVEKSSNGPQKINTEVIKSMNKFRNRKEKGTIDVWWLFDDGGKSLCTM